MRKAAIEKCLALQLKVVGFANFAFPIFGVTILNFDKTEGKWPDQIQSQTFEFKDQLQSPDRHG